MATQLPAGVNLDSPQIKFWIEYDQAFKQMKVDTFANFLHKDFRYVLLPQSLGRPERTKDVWLEKSRVLAVMSPGLRYAMPTATHTS